MVYGTVSYQNNAFGMATSRDGKNWTMLSYNPIFKPQNTFVIGLFLISLILVSLKLIMNIEFITVVGILGSIKLD